jgi:peptide deformylase
MKVSKLMAKTKVLTLWQDEKMNDGEALVLRTPCAEIAGPLNPEAQRDIQRLLEAFLEMDDALGLAAPQIGVSKRVIVFRSRHLEKKGRMSLEDCEVLINPRITQARGEPVKGLEGCLSCPDLQVEIERSPEIKVRALDPEGRKVNRRYTDLPARIVQHEMDHLEGRLIVDYDGAAYVPEKNKDFFDRMFKKA